jgi:hypothetical protein
MPDHRPLLRRFFAAYAKRMNDALKPRPVIDTPGVVRSFADYFVEASPVGVFGGKNGLRFRLLIPRGFRHYKRIGATAMLVSSLRATRLDELHYLVHVGWDSRYLTKEGKRKRIRFTNIYLVQIKARRPRIFAYITGDEDKVLKQHGLIA